jgi:hypothetical protein
MKDNLALAVKKRIKRFIFILTILFMPGVCLAADNVMISEVLYDPAVTESGGEAVELYNPTDNPVDISGWVLKTESSATDATIPGGTVLGAKTFYLVADSGWSSSRDNASWPDADHEEAITMSNSDAGVALMHANGTILDAVGWGDAAGISAGLYEGTPAALASPGNSLKRTDLTTDSDENSADFAEAVPDLQNSSITTGLGTGSSNSSESVTVSVDIENNAPSADLVLVLGDEDAVTAGVQISPVPGEIKTVLLTADVTDLDGTSNIESVTAVVTGAGEKTVAMTKIADLSNTTATYSADVDMYFHDTAGAYDVTVVVADASTNGTGNAMFDYLSMTAVSIDASSLQFTGATLGGTSTINGDFALSTADSPSVRNIGNTQLDIGLYGSDLVDGAKNIGIGNLKYSFDNDFGSSLAGTLSDTMQVQSMGLANSADSVISLGFQLFVPATTQNGNYTGQVTIVAVSS